MDAPRVLVNDTSIPDAELLYRGVNVLHLKEGNLVTSAAFSSKANPHVSVDLGSLSTPQQTHQRRPTDIGVVKLIAGKVREISQLGIARDPIDGNLAHAIIIADLTLSSGAAKKVARELAKACTWAIAPSATSANQQ